jgi:hypothetical protein
MKVSTVVPWLSSAKGDWSGDEGLKAGMLDPLHVGCTSCGDSTVDALHDHRILNFRRYSQRRSEPIDGGLSVCKDRPLFPCSACREERIRKSEHAQVERNVEVMFRTTVNPHGRGARAEAGYL